MNWYPWLNQYYRQIIRSHQEAHHHHALLVKSLPGLGDDALVWATGRWLMCQQPDGIKSCGICHGCQLMRAGNHPDWHCLAAEKGKASVGVDAVRTVTETLWHSAQQGGAKCVWLPDAAQLSEAAANALLKTLEEPPGNTWFFLCCHAVSRLPATLRSRCQYLHLAPPAESYGLAWLRQQISLPDVSLTAALRLSSGAPAAALALLADGPWSQRQMLCQTLQQALQQDILQLLPVLNQTDGVTRIGWLCALLVDAVKWQQGGGQFIINTDQLPLVVALAQRQSMSALDKCFHGWMICRDHLQHIVAVNRELLITEQLLDWEQYILPVQSDFID